MAMMDALRNIARRMRLLTSRAAVTRVDDTGEVQRAQLDLGHGEVADKVELFQQYGFTSVPPTPAEAIAHAIGAARSHLVALVAGNRKQRKKGLQPGEVAVYSDEGDYVLFKRGRIVEVVAGSAVNVTAPDVTITATTKVTMITPLLDVSGDITSGGNVSDQNGSMQEMRDKYNAHTHNGAVAEPPVGEDMT